MVGLSGRAHAMKFTNAVCRFRKHYVRDESGTLSIHDLIQGYKHQDTSEYSIRDGALLKALHKTFGLVQKTTRFSSKPDSIPLLPSRTAPISTTIDKETTTSRHDCPNLGQENQHMLTCVADNHCRA